MLTLLLKLVNYAYFSIKLFVKSSDKYEETRTIARYLA